MADDKQSMPAHGVHTHLPAQCSVAGYGACGNCPVRAAHPTAETFRPSGPAPVEQLFNAYDLARWQHGIWRRNYMAEGMKGSVGDNWWGRNGRDTINYVYWQTYKILSVDGKTITLEANGFDAREFTRATWSAPSPDDMTGLIKINGYKATGCIQPLAAVRFDPNSVLGFCRQPIVLRVLASDEDEITLLLDQDASAALTKVDDDDPADLTVDIYQYASPEAWQHVIRPDYFYGIRKQRVIAVGDVPGDGVYELEDTAVMHPYGFDPIDPCWTFEGWTGSAWEAVAQANERLYITPTWAKVAFKTNKPAEAVASIVLDDDLTATYTQFRLVWWRKATGNEGDCQVLGYARCKHSLPDYSGSMGTGYTGDGIAEGMYCEHRLIDEHTLSDEHGANPGDPPDGIRDTATHYHRSASGVTRYPADGHCIMYNTCDTFSSAEGDIGRKAPFQFSKHVGFALRELWGAANHRAYQPQPSVDVWQLERIMHPSLAWLAGYVQASTPAGQHPQADFSGVGAWSGWVVHTDPITGDESIVPVPGPFEGFDQTDPEAAPDGVFPDRVEDWGTVRDPLDASATVPLRDLDRIGIGIERDSGQLVGPGLSQRSFACAPQDLVVVADIDTSLTDQVQTCPNGTFQRFSDASPAEVRVLPLRQQAKASATFGSRVVHSVSVGGGIVTIELKNVVHTRKVPVPLMGVDDGPSWEAGGGAPIYPNTHQEIANYYETDKTTGSKLRGAWRGDAIETAAGRLLAIGSVEAFGGSTAPDWGSGYTAPDDLWSIDQVYTSYARKRDVVRVIDDAQGTAAALQADDVINFVRSALVMLPGATLEWTAQGSDDWQTVTGATHWYGEGLWEVPDAWFADKPARLCFRAAGIKWMDHRGAVPGSLVNLTRDAVDALDTCLTGFAGGGADVGRRLYAAREWTIDVDLITGCTLNSATEGTPVQGSDGSTGNRVVIEMGQAMGPGGLATYNQATVSYAPVAALGLPLPLQRIGLDDAEIIEAKMELQTSGLTRHLLEVAIPTYDCDSNEILPGKNETDTTLTDISYSLVGYPNDTDFEVIGTIPGASNGRRVVDATAIVQTMWERAAEFPLGFGVIFLPPGYDGDIMDLVPPNHAPIRRNNVGPCTACGGDYFFGESSVLTYTWDAVGIGQLAIKLRFKGEEKERMLLMPAWPSMADVVP